MATFDEYMAKAKLKAAQDIRDNPNTPNGLQLSRIPEPFSPTEEDLAALNSNNALLGLNSPEIPMRPDENQPLPFNQLLPVGGNSIPTAPDIAQEATPNSSVDVVKALNAIRSKSSTSQNSTQQSASPIQSAGPTTASPIDLSDKEYAAAQENANRRRMIAGFLSAGEEVGRGVAGLGAGAQLNTPKSEVIKGLGETSDNPIKDLANKRKAEKEMLDLMDDKSKNDPNSEVSKLYRQSFAKMGINIGEKATAADLEKAQPAIGQMINRQVQMEATKAMREQTAANREIALGDKNKKTNTEAATKFQDKVQKDPRFKNARVILDESDTINNLLDDAYKNGGQSVQALGTRMAKFMGEKGMLSEADTSKYISNPSLLGKLRSNALLKGQGKIAQADYANIKRLIGEISRAQNTTLDNVFDYHAKNFSKVSNNSVDEARNLIDPDYTPGATKQAQQSSAETKPAGFFNQKTLQDYAKKHGKSVEDSKAFLEGKGYVLK